MPNPRGRPKQRELVVSAEQKIALRQLLRQPCSSRSLAFRARIVLECASGERTAAVAAYICTRRFPNRVQKASSESLLCSESVHRNCDHTTATLVPWKRALPLRPFNGIGAKQK